MLQKSCVQWKCIYLRWLGGVMSLVGLLTNIKHEGPQQNIYVRFKQVSNFKSSG